MLVANRASTEVIDVFIDLNKGTVYLSSGLFLFFCMYIVLPFSLFLLYTSFFHSEVSSLPCVLLSSVILPFSCFSRFTLFSFTLLFWFLCAMCTTFPIPGRSIIIALSGDVQPRIKAPFAFKNILSRPWYVKISLTGEPSCWIHLVKPWICG